MGNGASTAAAPGSRALLLCHSSIERDVRAFLNATAASAQAAEIDVADVLVVTESFPSDRQARHDVLQACQFAIVAVDAHCQTSAVMVETLSFLKDTRKTVVAGPWAFYARPTGAVGAICTAFGRWESRLFSDAGCLAALARDGPSLLTRTELASTLQTDGDAATEQEDAIGRDAVRSAEPPQPPQLLYVYAEGQ
ncbi:hypothetical protein PINS_up006463 [Pythium insidiosum]|nr:hypothetical protein PINS_up006463 [Pythium insidiosum]